MLADLRDTLIRHLAGRAPGLGTGALGTDVPGLLLTRAEGPVLPTPVMYRPVLALVVQGAKRVAVGEAVFDYGPGQALVVGLDVPAVGAVTRADAAEPFLGLTLELDLAALREVAAQVPPARPAPSPPALPRPAGDTSPTGRALFVFGCSEPVTACLARLLALLATPEAIPVLHPLVMRELSYWMLTGPQGASVRRLVEATTGAPRILTAVRMLREGYDRPLRVAELAAAAAMSRSSFHQHFKALTALTPLQYQKQLRLAEARRLIEAREGSVARAAFQVGYESVSQFSREYRRAFGASPRQDARGTPRGAAAAL